MVAILGILAAIVMPTFQDHITGAKEAAAKDTLRILRNAIEFYASRNNNVPPGYPGNNTSAPVLEVEFKIDMIQGKYLNAIPRNSFNNLDTFEMIANDEAFPTEPTGQYGWVYQPQTKTIRLDWPGTDKNGVRYYDY